MYCSHVFILYIFIFLAPKSLSRLAGSWKYTIFVSVEIKEKNIFKDRERERESEHKIYGKKFVCLLVCLFVLICITKQEFEALLNFIKAFSNAFIRFCLLLLLLLLLLWKLLHGRIILWVCMNEYCCLGVRESIVSKKNINYSSSSIYNNII